MHKPVTNFELASQVEVGLLAPWHALKFEAPLEARYNEETARSRIRQITVTGLVGGLLVMMFMVSDYTLIPDVFIQAVFLRGILNPIVVIPSLVWVHCTRSAAIREQIVVAFGVMAELTIIYLTLRTHSPYRTHYMTGIFLIILYVNIVCQARFFYAVAATICTLTTVSVTVYAMDGVPAPVGLSIVVVNFTTGILTLLANFQLERQRRRNYLMTTQERLRNEDLAHNNLELRILSEEDPLTGVYNRRALDQRIDEMFERSRRRQSPIGVVMVDVDHFKAYNDSFGHQAGDRCLQAIAAILIDETRKRRDLVARFGGEEFIIVITHSDVADVVATAERIRAAIEDQAIPAAPFDGEGSRTVTASFGVSTCGHATQADAAISPVTAADLIRAADEALYIAKRTGRNRVHSLSIC